MKGFSTKAIHGARTKKDAHGSLRAPIYESVSFAAETARDLQLSFEGKRPAHAYSRISNPTVEDFEQKVRLLSDGLAVLATASGMAAISNLLLTLAQTGSNIVTSKHLFGNTVSLFERSLQPWGLEVRYVDMTRPSELAQAIDAQTALVFLEIITNPQLEVADISALSQITAEKGVPLVLDGTMTTPYAFKSKDFGVNVEIISSTKYISGGGTGIGGLIIDNGNFDWKKSPKLAEAAKKMGPMALMATLRTGVFRDTGACLSPQNAYMQALGLETLALRIEASSANSLGIARFLEDHPKVEAVNYPGLKSSPFHLIAQAQFRHLFGGVLTFDLTSQEDCYKVIDALKLIKRATNINDNKTMIIHPYSTIFTEYEREKKLAMGVRPTLLRLSVGIEDNVDIKDDLEQALEAL